MKRPLSAAIAVFGIICLGLLALQADVDGIYIQPYLQNVTPTKVTIQWWTPDESPGSRVEYGEGYAVRALAQSAFVNSVGRYLHRTVLTGLRPQTAYPYRVRSGAHVSGGYHFRTAVRRSSGFKVVFLGDGRTDDDAVIRRHRRTTRLALRRRPNLAFHLGDMVRSGNQMHWDRFWRRVATASDRRDPGVPFASQVPYHFVLGNHEIYDRLVLENFGYGHGNLTTTVARYQAYVDNPANGSRKAAWEERYYAVELGVATFIALDANNTSHRRHDNHAYLPDGSSPDWHPGSEQFQWLLGRLKKARMRSAFTFVLMHPSPFCRGAHGSPDGKQSGFQLRALDSLFRAYGVDAVITAHDHMVERSLTGPSGYERAMDHADPANLNYIVMGNSGQSARQAAAGWKRWMSVDGASAIHSSVYFYGWGGTDRTSFLELTIEPAGRGTWRAGFRVVRDDGAELDPFSLVREDPTAPVTYRAP